MNMKKIILFLTFVLFADDNTLLNATIYLTQENYVKAIEGFSSLIEDENQIIKQQSYIYLVETYYRIKNYNKVLIYIKEYFKNFKEGDTYYKKMLFNEIKTNFALKNFKQVKALSVNFDSKFKYDLNIDYIYFIVGESFFGLKEYKNSEEIFLYIKNNYPNSLYFSLAKTRLDYINSLKEIEELLKVISTLTSENTLLLKSKFELAKLKEELKKIKKK